MENEENTLNTDSNDIAGNRIDGPLGNTAARPNAPGMGTGIPGGPPRSPNAGKSASAATAASEPSDASEASAGPGSRAENTDHRESEGSGTTAAPSEAADTYGGNFSNSTQGSYHDQARRENQDSDPNRGEFGAQDPHGTTHGGHGNQNRLATYEPQNSAEDQYYGGAGRPGPQDNAYRAYDGRDERVDPRTQYGFEAGTGTPHTSGQAADAAPSGPGTPNGPRADNTNQPDRADALSAHQNDNGSPIGPDQGFAADYGRTSLADAPDDNTANVSSQDAPRRNQGEDGQSSRGGYDNQGPAGGPEGPDATGQTANQGDPGTPRAERPLSSQGYGDRGRDEPRRAPDYQTGDQRNGYGQSHTGNESQGTGSRGGSYNDQYDDSQPGSRTGSPAKGDLRSQDLNGNYGEAAREENRAGEDNDADYGTPRRNAGRDGQADE